MFQVIPTGGPMWNEPLSKLREKALIAVDRSAPLPADVTTYLIRLEQEYIDRKVENNRDFLISTWEARQAEGSPEAATTPASPLG